MDAECVMYNSSASGEHIFACKVTQFFTNFICDQIL